MAIRKYQDRKAAGLCVRPGCQRRPAETTARTENREVIALTIVSKTAKAQRHG